MPVGCPAPFHAYLGSDPHSSVHVTNFDSQGSLLSDPLLPCVCIHLYVADEVGEVS